MIKDYLTICFDRIQENLSVILNEEYFLYIIGSIFLLGIVTKWVVLMNYGRLIRKAENMTNPKNATLRQIKMKFESVRQVNGSVANPTLLVQRHLNKCRVGFMSLNKLNNVINWSVILIVGITGGLGLHMYQNKNMEDALVFCFAAGCFLAFSLEMINRCINVRERQSELTYVIVDFLENNMLAREERHMELSGAEAVELVENSVNDEENAEKVHEEQILNQIIGEFLQ